MVQLVQYSIVYIVWARKCRVKFPAGVKDFSLLCAIRTGYGVHPASYLMGTEGVGRA